MAANSTSSVYGDRLQKVTSFNDLKRAMQIMWWRGVYYHHGIVVSVDECSQTVNVIHLRGVDSMGNGGLPDIPAPTRRASHSSPSSSSLHSPSSLSSQIPQSSSSSRHSPSSLSSHPQSSLSSPSSSSRHSPSSLSSQIPQSSSSSRHSPSSLSSHPQSSLSSPSSSSRHSPSSFSSQIPQSPQSSLSSSSQSSLYSSLLSSKFAGFSPPSMFSLSSFGRSYLSSLLSSLSSTKLGYMMSAEGIIAVDTFSWPVQMDVPDLYYLHYDVGQCLPDKDVIQKGLEKMGENNRFKLLDNNCEHFATFCKTGEATSEQALFTSIVAARVAVDALITTAGLLQL